ncbi:hypothetical protein [uncultured Bradyrhizobium sp.]|uniref:hypothetical protein n=1 Tax=Bradyrhizobium sp. TaxID=376 RepID=UPI002621FA10|nr:hypothetical protein [uncultured Bradyrhizobium sp.]
MNDSIDEVRSRTSTLEQRTTALEQRVSGFEYSKADKQDVDGKADDQQFEKLKDRTTSLETKFGIAVAIAIVLGLGGAGIGGLLVSAQNKIQELGSSTTTIRKDLDGIEPKIATAEQAAISKVSEAGVSAADRIKENANSIESRVTQDLMSRLRVVTHQICTGEYDGPCPPFPRYDPRGLDLNAVAQKLCGDKVRFSIAKFRHAEGNCCGYDWYNVTCTSFAEK